MASAGASHRALPNHRVRTGVCHAARRDGRFGMHWYSDCSKIVRTIAAWSTRQPSRSPHRPAIPLRELLSATPAQTAKALAQHAGNNEQLKVTARNSSGRCWARTSDLRLVETALSQLS